MDYISPICVHMEVKKATLIDNDLYACHYLFEGDTNTSEYFRKCYHDNDPGLDIPESLRNVRPGDTILLDRPSYSCDASGWFRVFLSLI